MERLTALWRNKRGWRYLLCLLALWLCLFSVNAAKSDTKVYHSHANHERKIAITFDDGPHPILTPKILDILAKYNVKATFFLVGENVIHYPDVAERILKEGHEIGNHTYSHDQTNKTELERCEDAIYELTDCRPKLFRPPKGKMTDEVRAASSDLGYDIILWDIDTRDWAHTPPQAIKTNVMAHISPGSIILMHDYISYHSPTPEALCLLLPSLLDEGYQFVTVSELIGTK